MLKILHIATHAGFGGAGNAAIRIFDSQKNRGIDVDFLSLTNRLNHPGVNIYEPETLINRLKLAKSFLDNANGVNIYKDHIGDDKSSEIVNKINKSNADIVNLHWVNGMLTIRDIGKITKPLVWTLHDMWAFCGEEHCSQDVRWREGYTPANRLPSESGPDINLISWKYKVESWTSNMNLIAPSNWLRDCARQSALMRNWHSITIPHPIDTLAWLPLDQIKARNSLGYKASDRIIVFGAANGVADPIKGFDLLIKALDHLQPEFGNIKLLVFGKKNISPQTKSRIQINYLGEINDDYKLREVYSAADLVAAPSRMESFCQIAAEAIACGTPVVAFDNSGIVEVVKHKHNGYLAQAFDPKDFASGINWILSLSPANLNNLKMKSREYCVDTLNYQKISSKYIALYKAIYSKLSL